MRAKEARCRRSARYLTRRSGTQAHRIHGEPECQTAESDSALSAYSASPELDGHSKRLMRLVRQHAMSRPVVCNMLEA